MIPFDVSKVTSAWRLRPIMGSIIQNARKVQKRCFIRRKGKQNLRVLDSVHNMVQNYVFCSELPNFARFSPDQSLKTIERESFFTVPCTKKRNDAVFRKSKTTTRNSGRKDWLT